MDRYFIEPGGTGTTYFVFDRLRGHSSRDGLATKCALASSRDPEIAQFIADALNRRETERTKAS